MLTLDFHPTGHHFLQIPGPSPVPDRILRAMSLPTIDHRGPEFGALGLQVTQAIRRIFKTQHPVMIYPSSGTGAWEAALVNVLSPGDHVVMYETGQFAALWARLAKRLVRTLWNTKPELFAAPSGQRPDKIAVAAAALAFGVLGEEDEHTQGALLSSLGHVLAEIEANAAHYLFNAMDQQLLDGAAKVYRSA